MTRDSDVVFGAVPFELVVDSNYVAVLDLGIILDVAQLVRSDETVFEHPHTAAMACFSHPKTTTLIFCTGKVLVVGARNEPHALLAGWLLVRELRRLGHVQASLNDFRVCNITSTYKLRGALDILAYSRDFPDTTRVKIDCFPGITITFPDLKIVLVAFTSGSVNVTGCVHPDETVAVLDAKLGELRRYVRDDPDDVRDVFERASRERAVARRGNGAGRLPRAAAGAR